MAILQLIDAVAVGYSQTIGHTEPSSMLVDSLSIGRTPIGGHVQAESSLVNAFSAGKAADSEMYDMSVLKVTEL